MKSDDLFSSLQEKLVSAGLTIDQANEYIWSVREWHSDDLNSGMLKVEDILPRDECLKTLAEAQRIVAETTMNKVHPRTLQPVQIRHFLSIPESQWKATKAFIADLFGVSESRVDAVYNSNEEWLLKTPEDCMDVVLCTKFLCIGYPELWWKVFQYTGLLGCKETEKRINQLFKLLGPEDSRNLIELDAISGNWMFCKDVSSDPIRCIAYLRQCGLSSKQIPEFVSRYGYVLYLFNNSQMLTRIDSIIQNFLYEWQQHYGPCYEGLSQEEIYFLIHGPGKLEA